MFLKNCKGFSFFEVLVSMLLLHLVLFGLMQTQWKVLKFLNRQKEIRTLSRHNTLQDNQDFQKFCTPNSQQRLLICDPPEGKYIFVLQ